MRSYRFARRSFLAGVGGAFGLKVLLRNMEAMAAGATSPARFLLTHFPVGTLQYRFTREWDATALKNTNVQITAGSSTYKPTQFSKPFEDAGLRNDMTIFFGFADNLSCPGGGGHEAGTPFTTTCTSGAGTRSNGGEKDDGVAGGPSMDQVFLKVFKDKLARPGNGYSNAICDARVDSSETSTRCLSYSYTTRSIAAASTSGNITEYTPLIPKLSPVDFYADVFGNFMPGGTAAPGNNEAVIKALKMRKSVLDFSLTELDALKKLAPGSEASKIDLHADAIRKIETQLSDQIANGGMSMSSCTTAPAKPTQTGGQMGNSQYSENVSTDDSKVHQAVAEAHQAIIVAAFQCDVIRVASFQFSPGTNHVSFGGLWKSDPKRIAMHHPVSHNGGFLGSASSSDPSGLSGADVDRYEFLASVQAWYNTRLADFLKKLKTTQDGYGGNILDYTTVPYVTEVGQSNHSRNPKPAYLFGGTKLGLKHGTYQSFNGRPQADLYLLCAQAIGNTADPKTALAGEKFLTDSKNTGVISGLWSAPA